MLSLVDVVEALEKARWWVPPRRDRRRKIPAEYLYLYTQVLDVTFFSHGDEWQYVPVMDGRVCERCVEHGRRETFRGDEAREAFPWIEVESTNIMLPNTHHRCRCYLVRI